MFCLLNVRGVHPFFFFVVTKTQDVRPGGSHVFDTVFAVIGLIMVLADIQG